MKLLYIITITTLLLSCGSKKTTETETAPATPANIVTLNSQQVVNTGLLLGKVEERSMSSIIRVNGKIDVPPQNMVSISMPLGGYLLSTKLLPGIHITRGEVIAVMEDQQYIQLQQDYLTTRSKLNYLEAELQRQKDLNQSKAASDKVLQQTQMEYNTQKITLGALGEKLKLIHINPQTVSEVAITKSVNIYSPINGYVSKVNVNIGKYVNPADILFELINPEDIHLNLKLFEKDLDKLYIRQPLVAYTNSHPEKKYACEINLISKDLSDDKTADVHCHFEKYDNTLIPGMYMNAEIQVKNNKTLAVPEDAVISFEGNSFVFLPLGSNRYQLTPVETGIKENGYLELTNAKALVGKDIVTKGAYTLLMTLKNKTEE